MQTLFNDTDLFSSGDLKITEFHIPDAELKLYEHFSPLNEDALMYKCKSLILLKRHKLSNNTYLKFIKDYKDIYGEDFGKSFHEIIS